MISPRWTEPFCGATLPTWWSLGSPAKRALKAGRFRHSTRRGKDRIRSRGLQRSSASPKPTISTSFRYDAQFRRRPVALALAATDPCSPEQLESAIFVGVDTIVRVGMALGGASVLYQGIWPTRAAATLGAAAAACRIWGLSEVETKNALSLAVILSSGRSGRFHGDPSGRWIIFAVAVAAGVRAAGAAHAGYSGDPSVLDAGGLQRSLGVPVDATALVRDLGRTSVFPQLSLKPYCTSRQALPGAEAMRALIAEGLDPASIQSFTINVPTAYADMISQKLDPTSRSSAYVSGAGLAAIAALDPNSLYDIERAKVLRDPRIIDLASKGQVAGDPALDLCIPCAVASQDRSKNGVGHDRTRDQRALGRPWQSDE